MKPDSAIWSRNVRAALVVSFSDESAPSLQIQDSLEKAFAEIYKIQLFILLWTELKSQIISLSLSLNKARGEGMLNLIISEKLQI